MYPQSSTEDSNYDVINCLTYYPGYEVKFTQDKEELNQVKKLRIKQINAMHADDPEQNETSKVNTKNNKNYKKLIDEHKDLIHDGYDSHTRHLIVKDVYNRRVIAYVRIIDSFTAFKIGGFFSETRFNLSKLINNQQYYLEFSCLVVDEQYHSYHTINLLWSGLLQYAQQSGADAVIGLLAVPLNKGINNSFNNALRMISKLKARHMSNKKQRVVPYQMLPGSFSSKFSSKILSIVYIEYLFSRGIRICGDAYWNHSSNEAELFIYYKMNNIPRIPECIHLNEIELGRMCE